MAKASTYKPLAPGKSRGGRNMAAHKSAMKAPTDGAIRLHQKLARSGTLGDSGGPVTKQLITK